MHSQNKIARLCALTLLFSYAEMLLPRIVPFFRLGLSNAVILMAFDLTLPSFFLLCILKAVTSSLMAGTLFSPFFIISISQSVLSGIFMYALFYGNSLFSKKVFSRYGISVLGSALSGLVQIAMSSLYLGHGTWKLLGPILIFNTISGLVTAFLAEYLTDESSQTGLSLSSESEYEPENATTICEKSGRLIPSGIIFLAMIFSASVSVFFIKNLFILGGFFILSLVLQKICGRKIMTLPHVFLWLFIFISSVLVPNGKVLFKVSFLSITEGALLLSLQKSLVLSTVSALSQCATAVKLPENTLLGQSLAYYRKLLENFRDSKGNIFQRLKKTVKTS